MKIFIWEGEGISEAYHGDGTLVVLANSVEEARSIIKIEDDRCKEKEGKWNEKKEEALKEWSGSIYTFWESSKGKELWKEREEYERSWDDNTVEGMKREPDKIIEVGKPKFIAFNGGGYD